MLMYDFFKYIHILTNRNNFLNISNIRYKKQDNQRTWKIFVLVVLEKKNKALQSDNENILLREAVKIKKSVIIIIIFYASGIIRNNFGQNYFFP